MTVIEKQLIRDISKCLSLDIEIVKSAFKINHNNLHGEYTLACYKLIKYLTCSISDIKNNFINHFKNENVYIQFKDAYLNFYLKDKYIMLKALEQKTKLDILTSNVKKINIKIFANDTRYKLDICNQLAQFYIKTIINIYEYKGYMCNVKHCNKISDVDNEKLIEFFCSKQLLKNEHNVLKIDLYKYNMGTIVLKDQKKNEFCNINNFLNEIFINNKDDKNNIYILDKDNEFVVKKIMKLKNLLNDNAEMKSMYITKVIKKDKGIGVVDKNILFEYLNSKQQFLIDIEELQCECANKYKYIRDVYIYCKKYLSNIYNIDSDYTGVFFKSEVELARQIINFDVVIDNIIKDIDISMITKYIFDLAKNLHNLITYYTITPKVKVCYNILKRTLELIRDCFKLLNIDID